MDLTRRQAEIVTQLATGMTCDEVAESFSRSAATVRTQVKHACQRVGARNTTHLVAISISKGFIQTLCICLIVSTLASHDGLRVKGAKRSVRRQDEITHIA